MGMIVEFLAMASTQAVDEQAAGLLIGSLSINSLAVAEFFQVIASTELAPLIGDGADAQRQLFLSPDRQVVLMTQVQPWAYSASELLVQAFDALEAAVDEVQWRQQVLLICFS